MNLLFSQVSKTYSGKFDALKNVSIEINSGEMVFITGHSGAGKSTLLKLISVIERPNRGQVMVNDRNINKLTNREIALHRRKIGLVYQDHQLLENRTVFDNTALPLIVSGTHHQEVKKRVQAALDKVGLLSKMKLYPTMLSAGEQQRVGIARAIVGRPQILLADEPTGNLDNALSDGIIDLFAEFNRVGITTLIATHDTYHCERYPYSPVLELNNGEVQAFYKHNPAESEDKYI